MPHPSAFPAAESSRSARVILLPWRGWPHEVECDQADPGIQHEPLPHTPHRLRVQDVVIWHERLGYAQALLLIWGVMEPQEMVNHVEFL